MGTGRHQTEHRFGDHCVTQSTGARDTGAWGPGSRLPDCRSVRWVPAGAKRQPSDKLPGPPTLTEGPSTGSPGSGGQGARSLLQRALPGGGTCRSEVFAVPGSLAGRQLPERSLSGVQICLCPFNCAAWPVPPCAQGVSGGDRGVSPSLPPSLCPARFHLRPDPTVVSVPLPCDVGCPPGPGLRPRCCLRDLSPAETHVLRKSVSRPRRKGSGDSGGAGGAGCVAE